MKIIKGHIFKVKLNDGGIRYFQYMGKDISELNGDVIAIFKKHYTEEISNKDEIIQDEIECFMHTSILAGIRLQLWECVFKAPVIISESNIIFRSSQDIGVHPRQQFISHRWVIWSMNDERKFVGTLPEEYYNANIGGIYAPIHVIRRLETGKDPNKFYPSY